MGLSQHAPAVVGLLLVSQTQEGCPQWPRECCPNTRARSHRPRPSTPKETGESQSGSLGAWRHVLGLKVCTRFCFVSSICLGM